MRFLIDLYLAMFDDEIQEVRFVLEQTNNASLSFKLTEETRTILELANHIAQIPRIDLGIFSGELSSGKETNILEQELTRETIEDVVKVFDEGCAFLKNYFQNFEDEDLLKENLTAFYELDKPPRAWTYFFPKIITHLVLHKGILWSYLKAAKMDVNMFTYYGSSFKPEE